jgi:hypothetical protein
MKYLIIILLFFSSLAQAQVIQERNSNGADRRLITKLGFRLPQVCNPSSAPDLLNYTGDSAKGGLVYDSCNNKIKWWTGSAWDSSGAGGGSGVDTIYRKPGQDSIFFTVNGGPERAILDSTGGGSVTSAAGAGVSLVNGSSEIKRLKAGNLITITDNTDSVEISSNGISYDTLAIRKIGPHYVGFNSGFGGTGDNGGAPTVGTNPNIDSGNVFVGRDVGKSATTGWGNIGIGGRALFSLTSSDRQIAIGQGALASITNGGVSQPNIAIGGNALNLNNGNRNFAFGTDAAKSYTGNNITAIGYQSLTAATTGGQNVALGYLSGYQNTTGANNTYIGYQAGTGNTTSSGNVMIGHIAGRGALGNNNVAIGSNNNVNQETMRATGNTLSVAVGSATMLYNNGSQAAYYGADAGRGASATPHTGQYNNGFGYRANYDITGAVTGASNTVIGDRIALPSRTSSNQFVWGVNGVNYLTRFTGGGWLINYTGSAVTTQTASTALEVNGTTGAVLFPRLTTTQRDALTATAGMVIFNTTTSKFQGYEGSTWVDLH